MSQLLSDTFLEPPREIAEAKAIAGRLEEALTPRRTLAGPAALLVSGIAVGMSLFQGYAAMAGSVDPWVLRAFHLALASVLGFLTIPGWRGARHRINPLDVLLGLLALAAGLYAVADLAQLPRLGGETPNPLGIIPGAVALLLLIELSRRSSGLALPLITALFVLYALFGPYFPGMLYHQGYSFDRTIGHLFGLEGIYGLPLGVSATYVFVFVLFGSFLQASGGGQLFMDFAMGLAGRARGGPAKVSVLSSSLFGTISGSSVANVVVDGWLNIPLMKKVGYRAQSAAAVEALTSTAGQIMPPVMGAGAFLMAELIRRPYAEIVVAALLPAMLFFAACYWVIDLGAARRGIKGIPAQQMPNLWTAVRRRSLLFLPVAILSYGLVGLRWPPMEAAVYSAVACVVISWFQGAKRMGPREIWKALDLAALGAVDIAATCASAGVILGVLSLTGLGTRLAKVLPGYAGDNLLLALALTAMATVVLGMSMPTTATYAVAAPIVAPGLVEMGLDPLGAHLFVFYFACFSAITPPFALAAHAAAIIGQTRPIQVGYEALKLGLGAFLVPFMFVYGPALLMRGDPPAVVWSFATASLGLLFLSGATQGWLGKNMLAWQRALLLMAALLLIKPEVETDLIGLALGAAVLLALKIGLIDPNPALHGN